MADERETDADLQARYQRVQKLYAEHKRRAERLAIGGARDRAMRFAGSLNFAVLQIESELRERKLCQ